MNQGEKFRGLPIYWASNNGNIIIIYDQFAFDRKYKLYFRKENYWEYIDSGNFMTELIEIAKKSYYIRGEI